MTYSDWLKGPHGSAVRFVRGGASETVATATVEGWARPFTMIVDRTLATVWSARFSMRQGPRIELRMSRGLSHNLTELAQQRSPFAAYMHGEVFRRDLISEVKRMAQAMHAVANYDTPASIIEALLFSRVTTLLDQYSARTGGPLVIHDDAMYVPAASLTGYDQHEAGTRMAIDPGTVLGVLVHDAAMLPEAIVRHAEFLTRSDMATLLRMHDFLADTRFEIALNHWRTCFRNVTAMTGYELFLQLGQERLDQLQAALTAARR